MSIFEQYFTNTLLTNNNNYYLFGTIIKNDIMEEIRNLGSNINNCKLLTTTNVYLMADPFITKIKNKYYVFFEIIEKEGRGKIAISELVIINNNLIWLTKS